MESVEIVFNQLLDEWLADTRNLSNITKILNHPAYLKILDLGEPALPFIFRELAADEGFWFHALRTITGQEPVRPSSETTDEIRADWLEWGELRGLLSFAKGAPPAQG